jgi:hypothetical protein
MTRALPVLLLLMLGCANNEVARWKQKTDADVVAIVRRYQAANISEVETVLTDYLALADEYERSGWSRYGAPGWIDELRSNCEARLAVFYRALGNGEAYQTHLRRAIAHRKRAHPEHDYTEEDVCGCVENLDAANIQPNWRKQLKQDGAVNLSKPVGSETNRASAAVGSGP